MIPFDATIEEFEQGAWVADLITFDPFAGSFQLTSDGDTWTGAKVSERFDQGKYFTRVMGGAGKIAEIIDDKFYSGSASLRAALQDICTACGESFGDAKAATFLSPFMRIRGEAYKALDSLALAYSLMWWIGRDGKVQLQTARPSAAAADGVRVSSDTNACVTLTQPTGVQLGATYDSGSSDSNGAKPIRHIRWRLTKDRFSASLYFVPFMFRAPTNNAYDSLKSASVDKDNGDGTIDVIAEGRYGVTKVALYSGIPGSKIKVKGGESVTLGFFNGDPQKPFAVAMAQDTTATKQVARNGDSVKVSIPAGSFLISCSGSPAVGVVNPTAIDVTGTVTSGSDRLKVGDA